MVYYAVKNKLLQVNSLFLHLQYCDYRNEKAKLLEEYLLIFHFPNTFFSHQSLQKLSSFFYFLNYKCNKTLTNIAHNKIYKTFLFNQYSLFIVYIIDIMINK